MGGNPFLGNQAPVVARAKARRIPGWTLVNGSVGPLPPSHVQSNEPDEEVKLIP